MRTPMAIHTNINTPTAMHRHRVLGSTPSRFTITVRVPPVPLRRA